MKAGQKSGTGAMTELNDEKVRKNDTLSSRDKAQGKPGHGIDGTGLQVDEQKDPTNQRPEKKPDELASDQEKVDRPGFDLGGTDHNTSAGKGLGLGSDAKSGRKDWARRK